MDRFIMEDSGHYVEGPCD